MTQSMSTFVLRPTADHLTLLLRGDQTGMLNAHGEMPLHAMGAWCKTLVDERDTVVDVGAHVGSFALVMASHARTVHAIEASLPTYHQLCANALINHAPHLHVHHVALSEPANRGKERTLHVRSETGHATLESLAYTPSLRQETVRLQCLDDLELDLAHGSGKIGLLRVSVEGHEVQVLSGAMQLLQTHQPTILFECKQEHCKPRLFRFINDLGYQMVCVKGYPTWVLATPP